MLSVCTRLTPYNWTSFVVNHFTIMRNLLAVTFHITLLEIVGEVHEIVVIRQNGVALGIPEVVVPNAQKTHNNGNVAVQRRSTEMFIRGMGTCQQLLMVVQTYV